MKRTHSLSDVTCVAAILMVLTMLRIGAQSTVVDNGPHGIRTSDSRGRTPLAGAINAVVPHPTNPDISGSAP